VRELENVIERALVLAEDGTVGAEQLPPAVRGVIAPPSAGSRLPNGIVGGDGDLSVKRQTETLERTLIRQALERTGGNRTRAAQLLDLSHRALLYKIREYGIDQ
jgi:two-component system response regulator AtoC